MPNLLYLKHSLVRTKFEGLAKSIQSWRGIFRRMRHPELQDIYREPGRIDELMRRRLAADSNCIDVGCHIGSTLSLILKLAPRGRHFAFEPVPQKAQWLTRKFPEVKVFQMALADAKGEVTFHEDVARPGFSGLARGSGSNVRAIQVQCDRLDDVLPDNYRVNFLKVDVEGAELLVFRGATKTLTSSRPLIVFESGPGGAEKFGFTRRQLFDFVTEQGYRVYFVQDFLSGAPSIDFNTFEAAHVYPFKAFNFVAAPT